jgi:hypothetical protein
LTIELKTLELCRIVFLSCRLWFLIEHFLSWVLEDRRWKCCHRKIMVWWDQMGNYVFKNSFGDAYLLCKCDLLKEKNQSHLLHNLLYMDAIFVFTFYLLLSYLGIFDINYIISMNIAIFQFTFFKEFKLMHILLKYLSTFCSWYEIFINLKMFKCL